MNKVALIYTHDGEIMTDGCLYESIGVSQLSIESSQSPENIAFGENGGIGDVKVRFLCRNWVKFDRLMPVRNQKGLQRVALQPLDESTS